MGELFALNLDRHAKPRKRTWKEDEAQYKRCLARWKARKLSQVRPADAAGPAPAAKRQRGKGKATAGT